MSYIILIFLLLSYIRTITCDSLVASDFCRFDEEIKDKLRNIKCDDDGLDDCALSARKIIQDYETGTWGAVIVSKDDANNLKIEWNISKIEPNPSRCRLLINNTLLIELFRTGYKEINVKYDQVILCFYLLNF